MSVSITVTRTTPGLPRKATGSSAQPRALAGPPTPEACRGGSSSGTGRRPCVASACSRRW
eukprot:7469187-Lingulodinium_polyedra.AAC.1